MKQLTQILQLSLRKGDVFAWWNNNQVLLLLTVKERENLNVITHRLRTRFQEALSEAQVNINMRFQPLSQEISFLN